MKYQINYVIIKLSESKTTNGAFTYYVITEGEVKGGGGSLKYLCMIVGEGEAGWPCDDISK